MKSDLPFRAGSDEFVFYQIQASCKREILAAVINAISQFPRVDTKWIMVENLKYPNYFSTT